ncbi:MAG TPA: nucleotidyltransferase domain-containing protein [Myxococcota bacterium]|nr:nucleotidyltransferase domain-containing protein [Myxococcota bacterium]
MSVERVLTPASLEPLGPSYRALFERAVTVFSADSRVRALWLAGSVARGDADAHSDLDLVVTVTDADFDGFAASWREWLAAITPTVLAREIPFLRGSVYSLTPACERLDVVVERLSTLRGNRSPRLVVFDRDGLERERPAPLPPAGPDPHKVTTAIEEPLRYLALTPAVLGRGELMLAQEGYGHMRRRLSELFLELNAPLPTTGVKHWRDKLTPEQYAVLESLPWPAATRESLLAANLAFLRVFLPHARAVAEKVGVPWPEALERAVRAHLERELGVTF